jgi:8-oxo-dGTP diphosphatase
VDNDLAEHPFELETVRLAVFVTSANDRMCVELEGKTMVSGAILKGIRLIADPDGFQARKRLADCIILTADNRLLLQKHPDGCTSLPGAVHPFGGYVEYGESPFQAMVREIQEETGGMVLKDETVFLGAITEEDTSHRDLVHVWFWHDIRGSVTGCYEREEICFDDVDDVLALPLLMDYARQALHMAVEAGLIHQATPKPRRCRPIFVRRKIAGKSGNRQQ